MTTHLTILSHALTSLFHYANGKRLDGAHAGITGAHAGIIHVDDGAGGRPCRRGVAAGGGV